MKFISKDVYESSVHRRLNYMKEMSNDFICNLGFIGSDHSKKMRDRSMITFEVRLFDKLNSKFDIYHNDFADNIPGSIENNLSNLFMPEDSYD